MKKNTSKISREPNRIESLLLGCTIQEIPRLIPGVLLAVALVALFIWLTDLLNSALGYSGLISYILVVIIAGILVRNTIGVPVLFRPGIDFCLKKLLRLGIILMGIRLSFFDVLKIGAWGIPIVVVCVAAGLVLTIYFGRLMKLPDRLATLIAVGTGICGASAIVATAPGINAKEEEVAYAVANITIFGIIVMVAYPFLTHWMFNGDITMVGLFTGTAIHETAQVAASGLIYDQTFNVTSNPTSADIAIVTKLVRNVLMALVIPLMTFVYMRHSSEMSEVSESGFKKALRLFPLFILGFLLLAILRSIGDAGIQGGSLAMGLWDSAQWSGITKGIKEWCGSLAMGLWDSAQWSGITKGIKEWSGYILATAMAGVGLGTSFKTMKGLGIKPFYVGLFAAALVGIIAVIMVFLLGSFVSV